jgi:hypothetical protein
VRRIADARSVTLSRATWWRRVTRVVACGSVAAVLDAGCGRLEYAALGAGADASASIDGARDDVGPATDGAAVRIDGSADAAPDASSMGDGGAPCTWGPWGTPVRIPELNAGAADFDPAITRGGLTIFFSSPGGAAGEYVIFSSDRVSTDAPFQLPFHHSSLTIGGFDLYSPTLTADALQIVYDQYDNTLDVHRITIANRSTATGLFDVPEPAVFDSAALRTGPFLVDDLTLICAVWPAPGFSDLAIYRRADRGATFVLDRFLDEVNTSDFRENYPTMSSDGLEIFFGSDRDGSTQIYTARRASTDALFGPVELAGGLEGAPTTDDPDLSRDGTTIFFSSDRPPSDLADLWYATRECVR